MEGLEEKRNKKPAHTTTQWWFSRQIRYLQSFLNIFRRNIQLTALDKLAYDENAWNPPSGKSLSDYLLEKSLSAEVRKKIEAKFGQKKVSPTPKNNK